MICRTQTIGIITYFLPLLPFFTFSKIIKTDVTHRDDCRCPVFGRIGHKKVVKSYQGQICIYMQISDLQPCISSADLPEIYNICNNITILYPSFTIFVKTEILNIYNNISNFYPADENDYNTDMLFFCFFRCKNTFSSHFFVKNERIYIFHYIFSARFRIIL